MSARAAVKLRLDAAEHPLEAAQAAAYALGDRAHARVSGGASGPVAVELKPKEGVSPEGLEDAFFDELLHQELRLRVSAANGKLREYIVTRALLSAQPASAASAEAGASDCPECAAGAPEAPPALDPALESEIDRLLAVIEKDGAQDPLGVVVPWEQRYGGQAPEEAAAPAPAAPRETPAPGRPREDAARRAREQAERLAGEAPAGEADDAS